ncbi:regulator of chromosome condensation 1/beta-lactamase-inhibitor protein II [Scenedesmus sp. NREL 46B-D3]|nr:regulator of chromosome condensation 1/beta-lactamase-inhibitor protein II [Scenedesmus sp. NREL 46B-D3]
MALNDSIACWGGTPDTLPGSLPITQLAWKAVTVGGFHACGILKNDTVRCWGRDALQVGPPPSLKFASISAGGYHTCGLVLETSTIRCYASVSYQLTIQGYDSVGQYTQVVSGGGHVCAIHVNGSVPCWGVAFYAQTVLTALPSVPKQLIGGAYHTMALFKDGSLMVWGGLGMEVGQSSIPAGKAWSMADVFNLHACGITTAGKLLCWGQDTNGSVDGVPPHVDSWYALAVGGYFTCGITMEERVIACWGNNDQGQLKIP